MMLRLEFFGAQMEGAWNGPGVFIEFEGIPEIEDQDVFARIEPLLQLFGRDAYNGQVTEKPFPLEIFEQNKEGDAHGDDPAYPWTYSRRPGGQVFNFAAELEAKTRKEKGP